MRRWLSFKHTLRDRKSTRLNSSHSQISYAVFCLKKKIDLSRQRTPRDRPGPSTATEPPGAHAFRGSRPPTDGKQELPRKPRAPTTRIVPATQLRCSGRTP